MTARPGVSRRIHPALTCCLAALAVALGALAAAAGPASASRPKVRPIELDKRAGKASVRARVRWQAGSSPARSRRFLRLTAINHRRGRALVLGSRRVRRSAVSGRGWSSARFHLNRPQTRLLRRFRDLYVTATRQSRRRSGEVRRSLVTARRLRGGSRAGTHGCSGVELDRGAELRRCRLIGAVLPDAELRRANLRGADLTGASLRDANLSRAGLRGAELSHAELAGANLSGARFDSGQPHGFTQPDDDGKALRAALASARRSIDIVIYEFGGPNLVGQQGDPGWLIDAVERGVNVRLILNGEVFDDACTGVDGAAQADCAWNPELDPYYATLAQLRAARQRALDVGRRAGRVSIDFANNDFNITHQKTILIDAVDGAGEPLSAGELADSPTAKAIVMTGNLQAYPSLWGQRSIYENGEATLINADYLDDPAASCAAGSDSGSPSCEAEWEARDFGVILDGRHFADYVHRIESVFSSDFDCGGPSPRTNTNGLLRTKLADTWANGTTYAFGTGEAYPDWTEGGYYPLDGSQPDLPADSKVQGNSRKRQLRLIGRARESLLVYNEEMSDYDYDDPTDPTTIVGALARAGDRLGEGRVRVVMAGTVSSSNSYAEEFDTLVSHGVEIHLLDDSQSGIVYIHAKAIVADGTDAFVGSENFSGPSMDYNRELGLMLTNRSDPGTAAITAPQAIGQIAGAFRTDWRTEGADWSDQGTSESSRGRASADSETPTYPMACGPMPDRVGTPPADEQPAG